jgi:hypothetical protein
MTGENLQQPQAEITWWKKKATRTVSLELLCK